MGFAAGAADEDYCYLTTTGRVSGDPREIEIWFALHVRTLYMLSGGAERSNWVQNVLHEPAVTVRIGDVTEGGRARVVDDPGEQEKARALLYDKYTARYSSDLQNWRRTALPVAVDFEID